MTEAKAGQPKNPLGDPQVITDRDRRIIDFREVAGITLKPGDQIVGIGRLEDLDTLADTVAINLTGRSFRLIDGQRAAASSDEIDEPLSKSFRRDGDRLGYLGAIGNFQVEVCSSAPDRSLVIEVRGSLLLKNNKTVIISREATFSIKANGDPKLHSRISKKHKSPRGLKQASGAADLAAFSSGYPPRVKRIR